MNSTRLRERSIIQREQQSCPEAQILASYTVHVVLKPNNDCTYAVMLNTQTTDTKPSKDLQ